MKLGARYLVMRYLPLRGRTARRVTVAYRAYTVREAMEVARGCSPEPVWIQHRDGSAHSHRRQRREPAL